jgi:hypothetical protein
VSVTLRANPAQVLLSAAIDYAGLFPPAALSMREAVANYAAYRAGTHAWALGRFVVQVARLDEFGMALASQQGGGRWRLSALAAGDMAADIAKATAFNKRHEGTAIIDTLEFKAATASSIGDAAKLAEARFVTFHEISVAGDPRELLRAIAHAGGRAKIRTGGVTVDAFPEPAALARFLEQCAAARVPFKATAGLHHPIRAAHRLTGEPGSQKAIMHGFVNLVLAAAFAQAGWNAGQLTQVLDEQSPSAFRFGPDAVSWRGHPLSIDALQASREELLISFGSCAFEEPINDLQMLGWLPE